MQPSKSRFTLRHLAVALGALLFFLAIVAVPAAMPAAGRMIESDGPGANEPAPGVLVIGGVEALDPAGIARLRQDSAGRAQISLHRATGAARFVRLPGGVPGLSVATDAGQDDQAMAFFRAYGDIFGIRDPAAELVRTDAKTDQLGSTHLSYEQVYEGVKVFGAVLRAHFGPGGALEIVNGSFVPGIELDPRPQLGAGEAGAIAVGHVGAAEERATNLEARSSQLYVFREGFVRGVPGANRLVYEIEVGDGLWVREFVYVDAYDGEVVDQITGLYDALDRIIYDGSGKRGSWNPVTDEEAVVLRREGDDPTGDDIVDRLYDTAGQTYDLFFKTFGYDSWDGEGATMHSAARFGNNWMNAQWTGSYTRYGVDVDQDDIVAHEWGHAYTGSTHGLIYQWQSGALNESYSDIIGEIVDQLNNYGLDEPAADRTENTCSYITPSPTVLTVTEPADIARDYPGSAAAYGPRIGAEGISGALTLVEDGSNLPNRGCRELTNTEAISGTIALVERGTCSYTQKASRAQDAGAIAVIVINTSSDRPSISFGRADELLIPLMVIGNTSGQTIKEGLEAGVQVRLTTPPRETDESVRWLMGEESASFGTAIRDAWTPTCLGDPGKVTDEVYHCTTSDGGGVHSNSGISNHAFALLVDGGSYDGHDIPALGWTKTSHIYWRAMSTYQVPVTDFPDHADALEQSCRDLIGAEINEVFLDTPSSATIEAEDCQTVAKVIDAVKFRTWPEQCGFEPMLAQNPPPACDGTGEVVYEADFEDDAAGWTVGRRDIADPETFDERDWERVDALPDERPGSAFFVPDPAQAGNCDDDLENGALYLDSPVIALPEAEGLVGRPLLTFEHYVSSQPSRDGGNIKVSVNGGPPQNVAPEDFVFNGYDQTLYLSGPNPNNPNVNGPLAGEFAFHGTDEGTHKGTWGQTQIDLTRFAGPGDEVQLRFDFGTNGCSGRIGWYVDDVRLYYCSSCGDSVLDAGEACDDGNGASGDGCSAGCRIEALYSCTPPIAATDAIQDGGFESATDALPWQIASTWADSPLCTAGDCDGAMALEGDRWLRLGYFESEPGTASATQAITLRAGLEMLSFNVMMPTCNQRTVTDTLGVSIDATPVITLTARGGMCGRSYNSLQLDISDFADNAAHELRFEAAVNFGGGFVLDKVSAGTPAQASVCSYEGLPGIYLPVARKESEP